MKGCGMLLKEESAVPLFIVSCAYAPYMMILTVYVKCYSTLCDDISTLRSDYA